MIGQDTADGDPEATGLPSDSTTTPDATQFPTGTDAVYVALVDTFASDDFVLFGLTNEPGGNKLSQRDDRRGDEPRRRASSAPRRTSSACPHHIVSVQGNGWTSDISFYATHAAPLRQRRLRGARLPAARRARTRTRTSRSSSASTAASRPALGGLLRRRRGQADPEPRVGLRLLQQLRSPTWSTSDQADHAHPDVVGHDVQKYLLAH